MKLAILEKQSAPAKLKKKVVPGEQKETNLTRDIGLLILRLTIGGLLIGHGSQKLFGWFSGPGLKGTAGFLESMGLKPGTPWATVAASSEFGGGTLTALGFLHPFGPMATIGGMIMATVKVHWGKPIWATTGGAELPLIYTVTAVTLMFTGPGRFSLDRLFGIRLPRPLVIAAAVIEAALLAYGIQSRPEPAPAPSDQEEASKAARTGEGAGTL
jgi:putative oxidoreductase